MPFTGAEFGGGTVYFIGAKFTGGAVDFGWGGFAGDLERFEEVRGMCPDGVREAWEQATPGVLLAPHSWGDSHLQRDSAGLPQRAV